MIWRNNNCLIKKLKALNFITQFVFDSKSWEQQTEVILSCWGSSIRLKAPCTYRPTLEVRENELESFLKFIWSLWPVTFNCHNYVQGLDSITKPYFGLEIKNSWVDNLTFQLFHHWNTSRKMIKSKYIPYFQNLVKSQLI